MAMLHSIIQMADVRPDQNIATNLPAITIPSRPFPQYLVLTIH